MIVSIQRDVFFDSTHVCNNHTFAVRQSPSVSVICRKHPIAKSLVFFPRTEHWRNLDFSKPAPWWKFHSSRSRKKTVTNSKATPDCFVWTILIENQYTRVFLSTDESNSSQSSRENVWILVYFERLVHNTSLRQQKKIYSKGLDIRPP